MLNGSFQESGEISVCGRHGEKSTFKNSTFHRVELWQPLRSHHQLHMMSSYSDEDCGEISVFQGQSQK